MMLQSQNGNEETPEEIKDKKNTEMEFRREAMLKRCEKKQLLRRFYLDRKEKFEQERLSRTQENVDLKLREIEQSYKLAEELTRLKKAELQETVRSRKIKSSTTNQTRDDLKEKRCQLIEQKIHRDAENAKLVTRWYENDIFTMKQREIVEEKKRNYRKDLQNQLIENRRRFREKEEEKHRERKILEEVGEVIHNEDLQMEEHRKLTAALMQAEKKAFLESRQIWKNKRREALKKEHDENARIIARKAAEEKERAEKKTDTTTLKEAMVQQLREKLTDESNRKKEREEIIDALYEAEKDFEFANESRKQLLKKKHVKAELLNDMVRQYKQISERKAKENAIDEAFARYLMEQRRIEEENKILEEKQRRDKKIQYGNELKGRIMDDRIQYAMEILTKQSKVNCYGKSVGAKVKDEDDRDILAWNINGTCGREGNVNSDKRNTC